MANRTGLQTSPSRIAPSHDILENVTKVVPVTSNRAHEARSKFLDLFPTEELFGSPEPKDGQHLFRSVGVKADPPENTNHYIEIVIPLSCEVSQIPSEIDGVEIRIRHVDLPGAAAI